MTAIQWLVVDNVRQGWPYWTNICNRSIADDEYRYCVESEWIKDGKCTPAGSVALMFPVDASNTAIILGQVIPPPPPQAEGDE